MKKSEYMYIISLLNSIEKAINNLDNNLAIVIINNARIFCEYQVAEIRDKRGY